MNSQYKRLSPSCQQVIIEDFSDASNAKVIVRACMGDADLAPTVTNHRCNGVTLTPSGLYCDMALTIAAYIWRKLEGDVVELPGINVCDLEVHKPLIVKSIYNIQEYWLEMTASLSLPESSGRGISNAVIQCRFSSITPEGKKLQECGICNVRFESYNDWLRAWSDLAPAINSRIQRLDVAALKQTSGDVRLVQRETAYEMFQTFVQYTGNYQNMSSVTYHSTELDATSVLSFLPAPDSFTGPYYLDGSCHLSGFLCNAVEPDSAKNAFISNGVTAVKLSPRFDPAKQEKGSQIRNYVRMFQSEKDKSILQGNVYVLQDEEIVGVWESVKFKKIPRRVLNIFLPPPKEETG